MSKAKVWTREAHNLLYATLVERFGPRSEWETSRRPGRDLDDKYKKFLDAFADLIGAKSAGAVQQQIDFSSSKNGEWDQSHAASVIVNLAYALEWRFIKYGDLPKRLIAKSSLR